MSGKHRTDVISQNEARRQWPTRAPPPLSAWLGLNHAFKLPVMGEIPGYFQKKRPRQGKYNILKDNKISPNFFNLLRI